MNTSTVIDETVPLNREIYIISASYNGGSGTKTDPYKVLNGNIDLLIANFGDSCKVHFAAGNYTTKGFKVPKNFILLGAGKDLTYLKLIDNVGANNFNYPHIRMLVDNGWSNLFILKDLTLDGNWAGQSVAETHGNFKIEPVVVHTIRGKVENVRVTNFGSNGKIYGEKVGLECFPLCLLTFSNGEPFKYFPAFAGLIQKEDQTYIEISECEVTSPHFVYGGYCTAIFVRTNHINEGDRQPAATRTTRAATVKNNYVCVPDGIAYGGASCEMVVFKGNVAKDSKCGFNFDTFQAYYLEIKNNQFINCNQGINFTPEGGNGIKIDNNVFIIGNRYFNKFLNDYENSYAVNVAWSLNISANSNYISGPDDVSFVPLKGVGGVGNVVLKSGQTPDNSLALTDLMNKNIDITNKNAALTKSLNDLNIELVDKTQRLYDVTLARDVEKGRAEDLNKQIVQLRQDITTLTKGHTEAMNKYTNFVVSIRKSLEQI